MKKLIPLIFAILLVSSPCFAFQLLASGIQAAGDVTAPTFSSATINATAATVTLSEDVTITGLDDGDFVMTGSTTGAVNIASCSEDAGVISCTAASTFTNGETVTLAYTTGADEVEDLAGNDLDSFGPESVTNNTPSGETLFFHDNMASVTDPHAVTVGNGTVKLDDDEPAADNPTAADGVTTWASAATKAFEYDWNTAGDTIDWDDFHLDFYYTPGRDPSGNVYFFRLDNGNNFRLYIYAGGTLYWRVSSDGANTCDAQWAGQNFAADTEYHIEASYYLNGTTGECNIKVDSSTVAQDTSTGMEAIPYTNRFFIGNYGLGATSNPSSVYGKIDEFKIVSGALAP